MYNGFETAAATAVWVFDGQGTYNGAIKYGPNTAYSGDYYARIYAPAGGWVAVGRPAILKFEQDQMSCEAGFKVRATSASTKVKVEVIDPDTWTYIALKTYTISPISSYNKLTASWVARSSKPEVFIRVAIGEPNTSRVAYVDSTNVTCLW